MDNNNEKAGLLDTLCLLVNVNRNCHTVSNALLTSAVITEHHLCPLFFVEYKKILPANQLTLNLGDAIKLQSTQQFSY